MNRFAVSIDGGATYVDTDRVNVIVKDTPVGDMPCEISYLFDGDSEGVTLDLWKLDAEGNSDEIIGTDIGEDTNYLAIAQHLFEVGP